MNTIRAILIEDEINNQELLSTMLQNYCKGVKVCGLAENVDDGIKAIREKQPDVVFLDYQIGGGNGFDVLDAFPNPNFKVIFVTGYAEHAIKAIRYSALDYILKPISLDDLVAAVDRINPEENNYTENFKLMKSHLKDEEAVIDQIVITSNTGYKLINIFDIVYLKALQSYVEIVYANQQSYLSTQPLKYYEELLPQSLFFKTHKSFIINTKKVLSVDQGRGGEITLFSGHKVPIAFRRKSLFVKFLKRVQENE